MLGNRIGDHKVAKVEQKGGAFDGDVATLTASC